MAETTGVARIVEQALSERPAPMTQAEAQAELFQRTPLAPADEAGHAIEGRGRGRPPGALNKRTMAWAEFILGTRGSPLAVLAEIYGSRTDELALALGCTKLEALKEKREAARIALPYIHSPMPTKVTVTGKGALAFAVVGGDLAGGDHHTALDPDDALDLAAQGIEPPPLDNVEYQRVSDAEDERSNDPQSNDPSNRAGGSGS